MRGTLAAALTPLRDGGSALDEEAFGPYAEFLRSLDGVLALGTTGEGILLSVDERRRAVELFVAGGLAVIANCGAQTTAATVALAEHAATAGVRGVAVIAPPYFQLDENAMLAHFVAAARACDPTPFYVYEFERASGYAVPLDVLARLREACAEPGGPQGLRLAVGALRALPDRGPRRLRRPGGVDRSGDGSRSGRRGFGARVGISGASRGCGARAGRGGGSCDGVASRSSWSGSRGTPR